ncbi:argininosuccinate synthase [Desulfobacter curvatus]|uniref:argininosuccinate synthase n=1 Tax=Desulfobacter curvatus TaxID=2290 RepID=UPI00037EFE24|nr:argininosuccinate synthase [Desulfobacter curvatus]
MAKEKVVLAYSGGLDTSVILKWLLEQGYEVFAYMADIGQDEDFQAAEQKALKIGASKVFIEDMKKEFVTDYIFPVFKSNTVYEGRYLLGTAIARPIIAKKQIEIAKKVGAQYVSHGATGKGNDQVRFELSYYALNPAIKVIAPWKNPDFLNAFQGRSDLLAYAEKHGIPTKQTAAKPYSEDDNLLHISHEAGILEDPGTICDESIYCRTVSPEKAPDTPTRITIEFKNGIPVKVKNLEDGTEKTDALELFLYLNQLGAENGIGRLDMVENRFVGIKSRGVYETPGGAILHEAHKDIEGIAMDREVMRLRDMLAPRLGELVYYGFWFSPEMEFLMAAIDKSQELIDGEVTLKLYKGVTYPISRTSPSSLYNQNLSSMDITGGYNQEDAEGFIRVNAIRLMAHRDITGRN